MTNCINTAIPLNDKFAVMAVSNTRRSRLLAFTVVASVLVLVCFVWGPTPPELPILNHDTHSGRIPSNDIENANTAPKKIPTPTSSWCEGDECSRGSWKPRSPQFTSLADFQTAYANRQDGTWSRCPSLAPPDVIRTEEEQQRAEEKRIVDLNNWVWNPSSGKMKQWDPEAFLVRCLRSPGGVILIGDSITQQHFHILGYSMRMADIQFDVDPPYLALYNHKNVHQHVLRPGAPSTKRILERAGVPESRLRRPVITMLEDHMLIGEADIRTITERLGAPKVYTWYHDFQRVEDWETFVKNSSTPRRGEEETVTEDTVLVMNAGAHARHPNCGDHTEPYINAADAEAAEQDVVERLIEPFENEDERVGRKQWDWDLFQVHNHVWRRTTARLQREREAILKGSGVNPYKRTGAQWFYMDLWDQMLQRPDGHQTPNQDCLHYV
ncbi:uncharacterized protein LACBIDRAFT_293315 [Laccaria bicolor S238N-H82]|uniref:Predicted protein n=1 Tax=Laccaria bicolor (strain S238N-H82 / ATCC MYA-4686) TaxID=486041 RepID=B0D2W1_LACBS|nr:uncharacterized protein LACBIDRAFT_293315 [Laccaria bicolor S238N-H82]EDR10823.1 predicted protein [Laccaria bicolor S238N-H82]|eukprot:XP_001878124.1 predicted protein [Laccaria bicolor S238N-H82]